MASSGSSNLPLVIGGMVVVGGGAYWLWRQANPVVDVGPGPGDPRGKSVLQLACEAAAIANGIPPQIAGLGCGVAGALLPGAAKLAKEGVKLVGRGVKGAVKGVGKGVKGAVKGIGKGVKGAVKGVGKGVKTAVKYSPPVLLVKGGIKTVKLAAKGVKKVGKATKKVGKVAFKYAPPVLLVKGGIKGAKLVAKGAKKAAKKVAGWFGLGDADMDLAQYAMMMAARKRRPAQRRALPRSRMNLSGACGPNDEDCCQALRKRMPGHQFYERGLSTYRGH